MNGVREERYRHLHCQQVPYPSSSVCACVGVTVCTGVVMVYFVPTAQLGREGGEGGRGLAAVDHAEVSRGMRERQTGNNKTASTREHARAHAKKRVKRRKKKKIL